MALRKANLARTITGIGRAGSASLDIALQRRAIDRASTDLAAAVAGEVPELPPADLVVLCTPMRQFPDAFRTVAPALAPGTIVTDVGSTKADVLQMGRRVASRATRCSLYRFASDGRQRKERTRRGPWRFVPKCGLPRVPARHVRLKPGRAIAFQRVKGLWSALGMRLIELAPEVHDRWVATISHLPHAVAFSLVNAAARDPRMLEAAAGGFIDTTRVASSDIDMWTDIFLTNRDAITSAIDIFSDDLAALRAAIAGGDEPAIRMLLTRAKQTRGGMMARRRTASLGGPSQHTIPQEDL